MVFQPGCEAVEYIREPVSQRRGESYHDPCLRLPVSSPGLRVTTAIIARINGKTSLALLE